MKNASQDALQALAQALRGAGDERLAKLAPIARDFQEVEPHPDSPPREILMRLGDRWSSVWFAGRSGRASRPGPQLSLWRRTTLAMAIQRRET